ncbi:MAG: LPS assembly lipoprotein LptE [Deltaproteobacteria bacterium]|nr:LPS assembly lipoprotein LptE [Deltaproteobacteria bacterium]
MPGETIMRRAVVLPLMGVIISLLSLAGLSGCGYSLNSTPYRLDLKGGTLRLSVPVAENFSRFGRLGPALTEAVIERLSGTEGLVIDSAEETSSLKLAITSVAVGSGSWNVVDTSSRDTPEASSSRTAAVAVRATLTKPDPLTGQPVSKTANFYSYRTYMVSLNQGQVEMQESEALDWVVDDISQKIGAVMFNEF